MTPDIQTQRTRRLKVLDRIDLHLALRQMFQNDQAEFRGRQEEVLHAIIHRITPIVTVMGTSAGKSALFMLPAVIKPQGVTIVVAPVISLRQDLLTRCTATGI